MRKSLLIILFAGIYLLVSGQSSSVRMSLEEAILIGQKEAPVSLIAETRLSNNYWRYQSFLADLKPQISINATLPNLNRGIEPIILPNGQSAFIPRSLMTTQVGLELFQRVPQTGGIIFARSDLSRIDIFKNALTESNQSYLSNPIRFGFNQPLFQFNPYKWDRPLRLLEFEESKKLYAEERESIAYNVVNLFFDLYISQLNLEDARRQKTYADSLYQTSQGRFGVGRIAETDLLQIELRSRNAETTAAAEQLNQQSANQRLRNFLGITEEATFDLTAPEPLAAYEIDLEQALAQARANRSKTTEFRRRLMEAEREVAEAERPPGFDVSLQGSLGLSQTGPQLGDAYRNLIDQEGVTLSLRVPIADWGKTKANRAIAQSNMELTQRIVDQENLDFEREVTLRVQQFGLIKRQLELADRARDVAQQRLEIAKNRYEIGKIDVTDLNIALNENDASRRQYYQALADLWIAHYEIRNLTLYDFLNEVSLFQDPNFDNN